MASLQNLFVAKLPRNLTDADLERIFIDFKPKSAKIMLDAATGKSKGFGFVLFESEEEGQAAYEALSKTHVTLLGHSFNLCIFPSKHDGKVAMEVSNALYIRNIPRNLSQYDVEQFLSSFGNLTYCAMREDHYGSPVWVVYAEYDTVDEAKNALSKLHGNNTYFDYPAAVLAKYADSEETKRMRRRRRGQMQIEHTNNGGEYRSASVDPSSPPPPPPPPLPPPPPKMQSHCSSNNYSFPVPMMNCMPNGPLSAQRVTMFGSPLHFDGGGNQGALKSYGMATTTSLGGDTNNSVPPLASTFLNVTFSTVAPNNSGNSSHLTPIDRILNGHGTPGTPLSFSFGTEAALDTGISYNSSCPHASNPVNSDGVNGLLSVPSGNCNSLNDSGSGLYRHNPYALLTPISSTPGSRGSTTPRVQPISNSSMAAHFTDSNHHCVSSFGTTNGGLQNPSNTASCCTPGNNTGSPGGTLFSPLNLAHNHFASISSHGYLAAAPSTSANS